MGIHLLIIIVVILITIVLIGIGCFNKVDHSKTKGFKVVFLAAEKQTI